MAAFKAQIFGHSFVTRLKDYITTEDTKTHTFNLRDPALIQFTGFPGASVARLRQNLIMVEDFEPELVFLVVGTNDLSSPEKTPYMVASDICDIVDSILFRHNVEQVLVCQILHRRVPSKRTRYVVDIPWFNDRVNATNQLLRDMLVRVHPTRARFWYCKGFWSPEAQVSAFSGDGVHLSQHGLDKFYNSIRAAIVATRRGSL